MLDSAAEATTLVTRAPAPGWADVPADPPKTRPSDEQSHEGRCTWLSDSQINLAGQEPVYLTRVINKVTSPDGLQSAGNLSVDFDPGYQKLIFHHVRVMRDGKTREVDPLLGLEMLRRERDLERATFDGRLTAHAPISDVRVGDVVDVCYSLVGGHPMLAGHFCIEWLLNWGCWVGETRARLITQPGRQLTVQGFNGAPAAEVHRARNGEVVRTWRTTMTAPIVFEPNAPSWVRPFMSVMAADRITWPQVAATFRDLYAPQPLPADLESAVRAIEAETKDPAARVVKALRLVQGGLRYQAVTIGEGGFTPRPVAQIWSSRTGDCKDSSRLFIAILERLGVTAEPALVHTSRGEHLNDEPPNLTAFNHCIVAVSLGAKRYWLDPTMFPQGGRLDVLVQSLFGWALPLRTGVLEKMGDEPLRDSFHVREIYDLPRMVGAPGTLELRTTYLGWRADAVRRRMAGGQAAFSQDLISRYERSYGTAVADQPMTVHDDLDANRLEIVEVLRLGRLWETTEDGRALFEPVDDFFRANLFAVAREGRRWPIALGMPLRATNTIEIRLPIRSPPGAWDHVFEMAGLSASSKLTHGAKDSRVLILERGLTFSRSELKSEEARKFADFCDNTVRFSTVSIRHGVKNGALSSEQPKARSGWRRTLSWIFWSIWILAVVARLAAHH